jgi:hypothetical protein
MKESVVTEATATAGTYRPSPRPRPAGQPRPDSAHLHVVPTPPISESVPTSGNPAQAPAETISAGQSGSRALTDTSGFRVRTADAWAATKAYWTPPALFTGTPATLQDLADYAKHAPWTHSNTGLLRKTGVGYYRTFAYPHTVVSRYWEWTVQRPGRLFANLGLIKLAAMTGPGAWVVDTVIYPAARLVGHILL